MSNTAAPLLSIFGTTDHIVPLVLEDLTEAEARTRARGDEGPSIRLAPGTSPVLSQSGASVPGPRRRQSVRGSVRSRRGYCR